MTVKNRSNYIKRYKKARVQENAVHKYVPALGKWELHMTGREVIEAFLRGEQIYHPDVPTSRVPLSYAFDIDRSHQGWMYWDNKHVEDLTDEDKDYLRWLITPEIKDDIDIL